jgi:hypothetical protein
MSEPATATLPKPKITVVIDFPETPGDFHPVIGRSGLHLGLALHDSKRGCKALRLPLDQFRKMRADIFACKRHGQYPIPDVEIELPEGFGADAALVESLNAKIAGLEKDLAAAKAATDERDATITELQKALANATPPDPGPVPPVGAADPAALSETTAAGDPTDLSNPTDPTDLAPEAGAGADAGTDEVANANAQFSMEVAASAEKAEQSPEGTPDEAPAPDGDSEPLTPSEAGKILGNGVEEAKDGEAARVLAKQPRGTKKTGTKKKAAK